MATKPDKSMDTYHVGHSKPPKHSRFKPGSSGNPGGRKRGDANFKTTLLRVLDNVIEITDQGEKRKVLLVEALILKQAQLGLKGDWRATDNLFNRAERYCLSDSKAPVFETSEDDKDILDRFIEKASAKPPASKPKRAKASGKAR